jgi:hypothetical protein
MIYLKSLLAGLAALIILATLLIGAFFLAPFVVERLARPAEGGGGFVLNSPYVSIWPVIGGALFVFAAVSYWAFKRASRNAGPQS